MSTLRKVWHFLWKSDSILSWIVNIILAFILVKFIIYPGLGLILNTSLPVVAVVSSSMEHNGLDFDSWWENNKEFYLGKNIIRDEFEDYDFMNGFNKGDIIILYGSDKIEKGDIIVFERGQRYPIIHRVIDDRGDYITKGDNNGHADQKLVEKRNIIGKGVFKVPWLGWVKIIFNDLIGINT